MPYTLSTDYPALYALLLQGEEVACWVDKYDIATDSIQGRELLPITSEGYFSVFFIGGVQSTTIKTFSDCCSQIHLSFIPQHDVGKIAGDAWMAGCRYINDAFHQEPDLSAYLASLQPA